jgi:hypothetical protein
MKNVGGEGLEYLAVGISRGKGRPSYDLVEECSKG